MLREEVKKMKRKSVFVRYLLCLFILLLIFVTVFGIVRAQENSEYMRSGHNPQTIDYQDVSAFWAQHVSDIFSEVGF